MNISMRYAVDPGILNRLFSPWEQETCNSDRPLNIDPANENSVRERVRRDIVPHLAKQPPGFRTVMFNSLLYYLDDEDSLERAIDCCQELWLPEIDDLKQFFSWIAFEVVPHQFTATFRREDMICVDGAVALRADDPWLAGQEPYPPMDVN